MLSYANLQSVPALPFLPALPPLQADDGHGDYNQSYDRGYRKRNAKPKKRSSTTSSTAGTDEKLTETRSR